MVSKGGVESRECHSRFILWSRLKCALKENRERHCNFPPRNGAWNKTGVPHCIRLPSPSFLHRCKPCSTIQLSDMSPFIFPFGCTLSTLSRQVLTIIFSREIFFLFFCLSLFSSSRCFLYAIPHRLYAVTPTKYSHSYFPLPSIKDRRKILDVKIASLYIFLTGRDRKKEKREMHKLKNAIFV